MMTASAVMAAVATMLRDAVNHRRPGAGTIRSVGMMVMERLADGRFVAGGRAMPGRSAHHAGMRPRRAQARHSTGFDVEFPVSLVCFEHQRWAGIPPLCRSGTG